MLDISRNIKNMQSYTCSLNVPILCCFVMGNAILFCHALHHAYCFYDTCNYITCNTSMAHAVMFIADFVTPHNNTYSNAISHITHAVRYYYCHAPFYKSITCAVRVVINILKPRCFMCAVNVLLLL